MKALRDQRPTVLLVSDRDSGGAAIDSRRLRDGLVAEGISAEWLSARGNGLSGSTVAERHLGLVSLVLRRLGAKLRFSGRRQRKQAMSAWGQALGKMVIARRPTVLNLHNLHDAVSFEWVRSLPAEIPIVWTLHDMWPLTGYCCYSYDCEKYVDGCEGACPQIGKWGQVGRQPDAEWILRSSFFEKNKQRLAIVAPSRWLAQCAEKRLGGDIRVEHVPYGLDGSVFRPLEEKRAVRRILGLESEVPVILAGSQYPGDPRKGTHYLVAAVERVEAGRKGDLQVVVFGATPEGAVPAHWILAGSIDSEVVLNQYYNAADVFVMSSLMDNLPNTLVEATAAGTPCVAFDSGGCAEVVRDGDTGFVATYKNVDDLAACMCRVLAMSTGDKEVMSQRCRDVALAEYSLERQAKAYLKLFEEMTGESRPGPSSCQSTDNG